MSPSHAAPVRALSLVQKSFLAFAVVALAGSVAWRVWGYEQGGGTVGATPEHVSAFVSGPASAPAREGQGIERFLPQLTEASFFGLIGFALGHATRKVFRIALLVIAAVFVGVQLLVSTGHVSIDWLGVSSKLNEWILNMKENETWSSFLTRRVPSAGTLLAGYVLGFRRG